MAVAEDETATRANPETITDHPTPRQLQHPHHRGPQPRQQTMRPSMLSITAEVLILTRHMVVTRTIWPTINTMLSSRHSSRVRELPLHRGVIAHLHLPRAALEVHHLHHQVDRATAPYHLHPACKQVSLSPHRKFITVMWGKMPMVLRKFAERVCEGSRKGKTAHQHRKAVFQVTFLLQSASSCQHCSP
jgi:hypothetical protein